MDYCALNLSVTSNRHGSFVSLATWIEPVQSIGDATAFLSDVSLDEHRLILYSDRMRRLHRACCDRKITWLPVQIGG